jgi:hypothetical protein
MTLHSCRASALVAWIALIAAPAFAQTGPTQHEWGSGTAFSVFGGVATDSAHTGLAGGGSIGWEVVPWFGLEGTAAWLDRGARVDAVAADVTAVVSLTKPGPMVPFIDGGVGLYRTSFGPGASGVPAFYQHRMAAMSGPLRTSAAFTDPTMVVGGGINVFVSGHAALRPEIQARIVAGDSRTQVVTAFVMRVTYHIENHPVRRARGISSRPAE